MADRPASSTKTSPQRIWTDPLAGFAPGEATRHGRAVMRRSQRDRLLRAAVDVVAEGGHRALTVRRLASAAGVSNPTLYAHFDSPEEALLAACDEAIAHVTPAIAAAWAERNDPIDGFERALRALLSFAADEPAIARACLVEVPGAGSDGYARHVETIERLGRGVRRVLDELGDQPRPATSPDVLCVMVAGGMFQVVQDRVAAGQFDQLPDLAPTLIGSFLLKLLPQR